MSSGFITETEIAEARKQRQAEWEKVRQPDEPLEIPDEPYDSRSLFERLKEQKDRKDLEFEEAHKLKNLIRGLDDDEVDFLEFVDRTKMTAEKKKLIEEKKELDEFRQKVASLHEQSQDYKIQAELNVSKPKSTSILTKRPSQKSILGSGIVVKKPKICDLNNESSANGNVIEGGKNEVSENNERSSGDTSSTTVNVKYPSAFKIVGILPGIGNYDSDESSSDCTEEAGAFEFLNVKLKKTEEC